MYLRLNANGHIIIQKFKESSSIRFLWIRERRHTLIARMNNWWVWISHSSKLKRSIMILAICTHLNWRSYVSNCLDGSSLRMYTSCAGAAMYLERANGAPGLNQLVACPPLMPLLMCRWKSKSWSWCRLIFISDFGLFYRYKILPVFYKVKWLGKILYL